MPQINPKVIGDITYDQEPFWRVMTVPIKTTNVIVKGNIYSMDAQGRLIVQAAPAGSVAALSPGMFQAIADGPNPGPTLEDTDFVQVVGVGSRILLKAPLGMNPGLPVKMFTPTAVTLESDKVEFAVRTALDRLGTIFELYTRNADSTKKQVTELDDLVIVEFGMF